MNYVSHMQGSVKGLFWPTLYTGWRRLIGYFKLQVVFRKRATNYRALSRKLTYGDKASYDSGSVKGLFWYTFVSMKPSVLVYMYMQYVQIYIYMHVHIHIYVYIGMHISMYILFLHTLYMYIFIYIYIYSFGIH